ncbi:MAG TPA: 3-hydroxyacyl-ACP dehydratase FabZ family protein [Pirellulales bacterium]|jgi:3-hydroxyacyl-[acyl-carrier-protein] dehydratase|nr:3-hydroxyacyl-ACP dehydratase FabZ family protein [Pirellulales bacterium]
MRWFWIDRYTEFVSGSHATAVKNVSLAEDYIHDHFPTAPVMPNSLILEGLAQTGGLLVGEYNGYAKRVVLAKVSKVKFHFPAIPGDTLIYRTKIHNIDDQGAMVEGTSHVGDRLQAEGEIFFAHLDERNGSQPLFDPETFMVWLRLVQIYEVGRTQSGAPLTVPPGWANTEIAGQNSW